MKNNLFFLPQAQKELCKLVARNSKLNDLLKRKLSDLEDIDIKEGLKSKKIKIIKGISSKIILKLKKSGYNPNIYEYRDFPKSYPLRIFFLLKGFDIQILMIIHHKEMKDKFIKVLTDRLKTIE